MAETYGKKKSPGIMANKPSLKIDINEETVTQYTNDLQETPTEQYEIEQLISETATASRLSINNEETRVKPTQSQQVRLGEQWQPNQAVALPLQQEDTNSFKNPSTEQHGIELCAGARSTNSRLATNQEKITCRPTPSRNKHLEDQHRFLEDQALARLLQQEETHGLTYPFTEQHEAEMSTDGISIGSQHMRENDQLLLDEAVALFLQHDDPKEPKIDDSEMVARVLQVEFDAEHALLLSKKSHNRRGRRDQHSKTRSPDRPRLVTGSNSSPINKFKEFVTSPVRCLKELFQNETEVRVSTTAHHENHNPSTPGNSSNISQRQLQEDDFQDVIPDEQSYENETEVGVSSIAHHENPNPTTPGNSSNISQLQLQEDDSQNVIPDEQINEQQQLEEDDFQNGFPGEPSYEEMLQLVESIGDVCMGLSYEAISLLPTQTYKQNSKGNSDKCMICWDEYKIGDVQKILPCSHSYHAKCIDKWLEGTTRCPSCRHEIKI